MIPIEEEILVKDKTGKFKILRGGKFYDLEKDKSETPSNIKDTKKEIRVTPKQVMQQAPQKDKKKTGKKRELIFNEEDEVEILEHKGRVQKIGAAAPNQNERIVGEIVIEIVRTGIKMPQEDEKRLRGMLLTYLKDIRDIYELESSLKSGFKLSPEEIEKIIKIVKKKGGKQEEALRQQKLGEIKRALEAERSKRENDYKNNKSILNEDIKSRWQKITRKKDAASISLPKERVPDLEERTPEVLSLVEFSDFLDEKQEKVRQTEKPSGNLQVEQKEKEEKQESPGQIKSNKEKDIAKPKGAESSEPLKKDEPKPLQVVRPVNIPVRRPPPVFRKDEPRLDDVKYVPKIVGPIDELRDMTIVNFRRLSSSPEGAAEKIKEKLKILEHDSIVKRFAGIKAWQESEVVKIYLEISRECLSRGASADQVIAARESAGRPTLNQEEYRVILELNKFLRY